MNEIDQNIRSKNNSMTWLVTMLLALTAGGIGGYFSYSFFTSPGLSILNEITPDLMNRTRPIIQEAKKVTVEQNDQTQNVANNLSNNLFAINQKQDKPLFDWQKNYYDPSERVGEALPMTSDGWLVTNYNPISDDLGRSAKKFVVLSHDGNVFEIERVVKNTFLNLTYFKIANRNLTVSKFSEGPQNKNGNILVGTTFNSETNIYYQVSSFVATTSTIKTTDNQNELLKLNQRPSGYLALTNLANEIEAFVTPSGITSARLVKNDFSSFLKYNQIRRSLLGFNYLDLDSLAYIKNLDVKRESHFMAYSDILHPWPKNSAAQNAGLKNGDLISAVNDIEITQDNKNVIFNIEPGASIKISGVRQGKSFDLTFKAGETK